MTSLIFDTLRAPWLRRSLYRECGPFMALPGHERCSVLVLCLAQLRHSVMLYSTLQGFSKVQQNSRSKHSSRILLCVRVLPSDGVGRACIASPAKLGDWLICRSQPEKFAVYYFSRLRSLSFIIFICLDIKSRK
jgi:hypothetical protein